VKGGRVLADWPGLRDADLLDGRDLKPTTDLRSVAMGVLREHLQVPEAAFAAIFPNSETVKPLEGIVRS
jgi:uncharacterized protein (DUF1501 family)